MRLFLFFLIVFFSCYYGVSQQKTSDSVLVVGIKSEVKQQGEVDFIFWSWRDSILIRAGENEKDTENIANIKYYSNIDIQSKKNTSVLYTGQMMDVLHNNTRVKGILYKPRDFNSSTKYPVIVSLIDKETDGRDFYLSNGILNSGCFASNGYLVFEIISTVETGRPGPAMLEKVMASVDYLKQYAWVDTAHFGIHGQGTSGYFVNYIITQTAVFKAAQESSGQTDLVSHYGSITGRGESLQTYYDGVNGFFGKSLWQDSAAYIWQSPVILANKIQTPLLILHNKGDDVMPFAQSIELFTGMRRLGKLCWLLHYDKEHHTLTNEDNRVDFSIRLRQFFNHYLKDSPAPAWMLSGVPAKI